MRPIHSLFLVPALLLPLAATAQPSQGPAANAAPPPTEMRRDPAGAPSAERPRPEAPPPGVGTPRNLPPRTSPPPGHETLPAPAVPGAQRPERSGGVTDFGNSPVPSRPGARPDASTTGR
ncbi:hypothetical protein [Falsiroseomonas tokyonensis]|uniref:Translation initiation factor IF-2 n=1 Tax=Falsiroseomonas tokyonensis TaxID=430521 RepID=A0ABV7BSQ0_9PROT|nr:hypothetical protein [Falsiroseomonas tokyonensis]MBU8538058.1 hypothetical protein [Falsiroseomonas tokyonensis]